MRESRLMLTDGELGGMIKERIDFLIADPSKHTLGDLKNYKLSPDKNTMCTQIAMYEILYKTYDPKVERIVADLGGGRFAVEIFRLSELSINEEKLRSLIGGTSLN